VFEMEVDLEDDPFAPPGDDEREREAAEIPADAAEAVAKTGAPAAETRGVETFMRESPVLSATARPLPRFSEAPSASGAEPSPTAATLAALAAEVGHLGVPEGHRAAARAELLDLARKVDSGQDLTWDSLRGVIGFVMEYPPLARRVIPMLIPFLDLAA
jgi:hypothetical protein